MILYFTHKKIMIMNKCDRLSYSYREQGMSRRIIKYSINIELVLSRNNFWLSGIDNYTNQKGDQ